MKRYATSSHLLSFDHDGRVQHGVQTNIIKAEDPAGVIYGGWLRRPPSTAIVNIQVVEIPEESGEAQAGLFEDRPEPREWR